VISQEDKLKCKNMFESNKVGNFVEGDKAKGIFLSAGLTGDVLRDVWEVSDMDRDGKLSLAEFTVAIFLITSLRSGKIKAVPQPLPPSLLQSIAGVPAPVAAPNYSSITITPSSSLPAMADSATSSPVPAPSPELSSWTITSEERARFNAIFDQQDVRHQGILSGVDLREFLVKTGLPPITLGQVWALSDSGAKGYLTRDEFCVILKLLNRTLAGLPLPQAVPPELQPAGSVMPVGISPADVAQFGAEGAVAILEKRKEIEVEERANRETESKIETFHLDVDELKRRRAAFEDEIAAKQRGNQLDQEQLEELRREAEQGAAVVRTLETTVQGQSAEIESRKAILAEHEAKVKSLQQEKVNMSETVSREQARVQNQILNLQHVSSQLRNQLAEVENQKKRLQQILDNQTRAIERVKNDEEVADVDTSFFFAPPREVDSNPVPESPLTHTFAGFDDSFGGPSPPAASGFLDDDPFNPSPTSATSASSMRSQTLPTSPVGSSAFAAFGDDFGSLSSSASRTSSAAHSAQTAPVAGGSFASFGDDPFGSSTPAFGSAPAATSVFAVGFDAPPRSSSDSSRQATSAFDDAFDDAFGGVSTSFPPTSKSPGREPVKQIPPSPQVAADPRLGPLVSQMRGMNLTQDEKKLVEALKKTDYNLNNAIGYLLDHPN